MFRATFHKVKPKRRRLVAAGIAVAAGLATAISFLPSATAADRFVAHIDAGGSAAFTDARGTQWQADTGFSDEGWSYTTPRRIRGGGGRVDLYRSEHVGMKSFELAVPAAGSYRVTLHLAEIWYDSPNQRIFSVKAEGTPFVTDLDLVARYGAFRAANITKTVNVTDGKLNLDFSASKDLPTIEGISVVGKANDTGSTTTTTAAPQTTTTTAPNAATTTTTPLPTTTTTAVPSGETSNGPTVQATTANFASMFNSAKGGETIVLAAGNYGTFKGGAEPSMVTIKAASKGSATMSLEFSPASNITVDGLTIPSIEIGDAKTKNITVKNSDIPGQTIVRTGEVANANILFDHNVHGPFEKCSNCYEGRFEMPENTNQPSGITIQNSRFGPGGNSDGIQNGSNGTKILNNEFVGLHQGADNTHVDAIQLYGSKNTVIRGNYFHDVATGIMAPDGMDHEIIENNVIDPGEYPYAIMVGSDKGSIIRHNTLPDGVCAFNLRCGIISIDNKDGDPVSQGTVVTDNIVQEVSVERGTGITVSDNLVAGSSTPTGNLHGLPTYAEGAKPTTFAGYYLAQGSLGLGKASDGNNIGINP